MSCHDVRQSSTALLAGGLALTEWAPIEAHLLRCEECRQALDQIFRMMPAEAAERRSLHKNAYGLAVGVAAAVLLVGGGGYAHRAMRHAEPVAPINEPLTTPTSVSPSPVLEGQRVDTAPQPASLVKAGRPNGPTGAGLATPTRSDLRAAAVPKPAQPAGMDVVVQLAAQDRKGAERDLSSLVGRVGGAKVTRGRDSTLRATVPRSRYREFTRGLDRIGSWEVERRSVSLPDPVRVAVRLAKR